MTEPRWIPTFGPSRQVARINVEPSPALDLLQVSTVGEGYQLTNLFHLDRAGAEALVRLLGDGLAALDPQHFEAAGVKHAGAEVVWTVLDTRTGQAIDRTWRGPEGATSPELEARAFARELNRGGSDSRDLS